MGWHKIDMVPPPVGRPILVRTAESSEPVIAFVSQEGVWYAGGALVQSVGTLLAATPVEWCEPEGNASL